MHIAIGHYVIGAYDGVNSVMWRTINELLQIDPKLKITLFGMTTDTIDQFLPWDNDQLTYVNFDNMSPDYPVPGLEGRNVRVQRVHDYIWHGTNVAEQLRDRFADADLVLMENLSIGVNPAVTYAFYLWSLWEHQAHSEKRFMVRVHDFAQQRPANFENIKKFKKFQDFLHSERPDWHQILYPSAPNIEYLTINTNDYYRLLDHGIDAQRVWYLPNCIDNSLTTNVEPCQELRRLLSDKKGIDPQADILYYPVRAIPRKNIEEAFYLLRLINLLAAWDSYREKYQLARRYHLIVSLKGQSEDESRYAATLERFIADHDLPATIDISDLVGLRREYDPDDPSRLVKFGVADMYSVASMTISTSLMEGFGFVFIEPWMVNQCVIGRNIPWVTTDFTKAGISFDHLYDAWHINGSDFADLGASHDDGGLARRLDEITKLDDPQYLQTVIEQNRAALLPTLELFARNKPESPRTRLVRNNQSRIKKNYSGKEVVGLLNRIIWKQEEPTLEPKRCFRIPKSTPQV